FMQSLEFPLTF
nr:immunoglobulin light chain junction region [Macaca mulatta]